MRENEDVKVIVDFIVLVLSNKSHFDEEIIEKVIEILAFLVDWNKLDFF